MKATKLSGKQIHNFRTNYTFSSFPTISLPSHYPKDLIDSGIKPRTLPRNKLVGSVRTFPRNEEISIETVFYDRNDRGDNGDLHVINLKTGILTSYYRGKWGKYVSIYGKQHREKKDYLREDGQQLKQSDSV